MDTSPVTNRSWGTYQVISGGTRWLTRLNTIIPGAATAMQRHKGRTEHWLVLEGSGALMHRADDVIGDRVFGDRVMSEGDTAVIHPMEWRKIKNVGSVPLVLIETWIGSLEEDGLIGLVGT